MLTLFGSLSSAQEACREIFAAAPNGEPFLKETSIQGFIVHFGTAQLNTNKTGVTVLQVNELAKTDGLVFKPDSRTEWYRTEYAARKTNAAKLQKQAVTDTYAGYTGRIDPSVIKIVSEADQELDPTRVLHIFAQNRSGNFSGGVRVFNGTPRANSTRPELPLEKALRLRGERTELIENRARAGEAFSEIGKFSILATGQERKDTARLIDKALLNIIQWNTRYYAHVESEVHLRLYRDAYGFAVDEVINVQGKKEYILSVEGKTLSLALKKRVERYARQASVSNT